MPIWFPFVPDGTNPTALYNCFKQETVMVVLQLASTVMPPGRLIFPPLTVAGLLDVC